MPTRWMVVATVAGAVMAGCGSPSAEADRTLDELGTEVAETCESTRDLHNELAAIANEMAAAEVAASPTERAEILAAGLAAMVDTTERAVLGDRPDELVVGLEQRRVKVVAEMRVESESFRAAWPTVSRDERSAAVTQIFTWAEKLMSETEPRIDTAAGSDLLAAVSAEPACRHTVQLP